MTRYVCARVYTLDPEDATDCIKRDCDRIGWVEVEVRLAVEGLHSVRVCELHAGDFITAMLPRFNEVVPA